MAAQRRWRDDPAQWLTSKTILTMSQRILAEVSSPLESPDEATDRPDIGGSRATG
jgi:hypothetical protein